ncbi:PH domain-containing protein [Miniimonas sp. S16]|uniref:PH domain-containing protein n=1 Tax=Miniimonas sp. S16 TaxID=2171623 RepID=UPI000D525B5D|nr:PH domain-containing protein [Miniimonas sp. S16]
MGTTEFDGRAPQAAAWTFRPRGNYAWAVLTASVAAGWLWAAAESGPRDLTGALPWAALVALAGWLAFVRPRVDVTPHGVTLVNPLRTVHVPWEALIQVSTRHAMTLHTPHGRYAAWAAPGPGRHGTSVATVADVRRVARGGSAAGVGFGDLPTAPSGVAAHQVRVRWQRLVETGQLDAGQAETALVVITYAWPWITAASVLAALGVAAAALG